MKKLKKCLYIASIIAVVGCTFFYFEYQNFQPSTDFDNLESHLMIWSPSHEKTYVEFIKTLSEDDSVTLYVPKKTPLDTVKNKLLKANVNLNKLTLIPIQNERIWIRDFGPVFLENKYGSSRVFCFKYYQERKSSFPYEYQKLIGKRIYASRILNVGGAREVNGDGLAILIESHERMYNPELSLKDIEKELKRKMGIKKVIWLKDVLPQDEYEGTELIPNQLYSFGAGHIDNFCRFISPDTILLAQVPFEDRYLHPILQTTSDRLEKSYEILKNSLDQDNNPLHIVRVPIAPFLVENNFEYTQHPILFPTSYLNFVIGSKKVVVPSYGEYLNTPEAKERDILVHAQFKTLFPSKKIIMQNCADINKEGGGFHCISLNKTRKKTKKLT
ncbi:agmatine deiminase family protein [Tamlana fucoidanivorans]|uniref:Agmatine deiminase family protein n=1 Tax=Allotamlana fucoidanivorans TaxID=2583814 RepID=A0A5C4SDS5_9FLAO|nr:agmatine deiminase family protein [Tamlana fucoidanivorans]TNJ41677.1 agmatine deiminase family protein [Tamlana fucoidanivorans]